MLKADQGYGVDSRKSMQLQRLHYSCPCCTAPATMFALENILKSFLGYMRIIKYGTVIINYRYGKCNIDLIVRKNRKLTLTAAFLEMPKAVSTVRSSSFGSKDICSFWLILFYLFINIKNVSLIDSNNVVLFCQTFYSEQDLNFVYIRLKTCFRRLF